VQRGEIFAITVAIEHLLLELITQGARVGRTRASARRQRDGRRNDP